MRRFLFLLTLFLAQAAGPAAGQPAADLTWPEVTREARPWTRWWWMGNAVDRENLTAELEALAAAGFGGVEVTGIYGVHGYEHAFIPYLSDRWNEMLLHAATEARRLDMGLDMPPGSGWRTGGPLVPAEEANARLHVEVDTVRAGAVWRAEVSGRLEAVAAFSEDGAFVDLRPPPGAGGPAAWTAPAGRWHVYTAETRLSGDRVKRPSPGGEGYALDPFSRDAVRHFLDAYGARIRALPSGTVRSFFHDSFEYTGNGSAGLFEAFRARRGYDLTPHLPALLGHGEADRAARVKSDYRETLSELLLEHFLQPLRAWAHARGSLSRNQAHGSPGNLLDLYAAADIPETEIFGPLGGPDNDPLISKFASSAAHVAGKTLTSAEAATWLGEHFTVSLDDLKQAVDQLFVSGVNHLFFHGTAYSPREAAWPGWLFYASTQVNRRNAFWRDLPALNRYITRVQSVLQAGRPDADVLLYWPVYDNWHDPEGLRISFGVHRPDWFYGRPVSEAARVLWRRGYGFDYVSDRQLRDVAASADGGLATGGAAYRAVVVPPATHVPAGTLERLLELAEAGGTVVFLDRLPEDVPGLADLEARRQRLSAVRQRLAFGAPGADGVRRAAVGRGRVLLGPALEPLLEAAGIPREPVVDHPGVQFIRRRHDGSRHYFIRHAGTEPLEGWVPLGVPAAAVALLDPADGRTGLARLRAGADGRPEVYLQLAPGGSVVLRTFDEAATGASWPYLRPQGPPTVLRGPWTVTFVDGGPALPAPYRTDTLASWTARDDPEARRFAGTARYTLRFDAPAGADRYLLDLGRVAESARVRLNGTTLGTLFARPFQIETGPLRPTGNELELEVTNLSANRIRDLDRRGVPWKVFHDINFVNLDYKPFDASGWPLRPSGLLGPVRLQPLSAE